MKNECFSDYLILQNKEVENYRNLHNEGPYCNLEVKMLDKRDNNVSSMFREFYG